LLACHLDPDLDDELRKELIERAVAGISRELSKEFALEAPVRVFPGKPIDFPGKNFNRAVRSRKRRKTYNSPVLGLDPNILLPTTEPAEPANIAMLVDVSGSMSDSDIETSVSIVKRALSGRRGRVRVLCHDTRRVHDEVCKPTCVPNIKSSGGGTELKQSLIGVECDACIIVSDLESGDGLPEPTFPVFSIGSHRIPEGWQKL